MKFTNTWPQYKKNLYIDKLDNLVNKCNNPYHITITMKHVDVKPSTYIDTTKEINNKDSKFKNDDVIRIWKYKNIFAKSYFPNCSQEVFVIKKVQNTFPWRYVISDLKDIKLLECFAKKKYKSQIKKSLEKMWREE